MSDTDHSQRDAFNAGFDELGLMWHWDAATWQRVSAGGPEEQWLRRYLEAEHPHLLTAYDADFLVGAILDAKARHARRTAHASRQDALSVA